MLEVGDIVRARDTKNWYGIILNSVGSNVYVEWFDREHERNGWFLLYMLEKVHHA
jgi:hypothetical protein